MRPRISIWGFVRSYVRMSVCPSVRPLPIQTLHLGRILLPARVCWAGHANSGQESRACESISICVSWLLGLSIDESFDEFVTQYISWCSILIGVSGVSTWRDALRPCFPPPPPQLHDGGRAFWREDEGFGRFGGNVDAIGWRGETGRNARPITHRQSQIHHHGTTLWMLRSSLPRVERWYVLADGRDFEVCVCLYIYVCVCTHELNYREAWGTVIPWGPLPHLKVALLLAPCNIYKKKPLLLICYTINSINIMGWWECHEKKPRTRTWYNP